MSTIPPEAPPIYFIPRPDDPNHLIGEEWAARGYESFYIAVPPDPCIVDGTPLNACTGEETN
jgi:hypothetical protein